jgi:hypothetical protein
MEHLKGRLRSRRVRVVRASIARGADGEMDQLRVAWVLRRGIRQLYGAAGQPRGRRGHGLQRGQFLCGFGFRSGRQPRGNRGLLVFRPGAPPVGAIVVDGRWRSVAPIDSGGDVGRHGRCAQNLVDLVITSAAEQDAARARYGPQLLAQCSGELSFGRRSSQLSHIGQCRIYLAADVSVEGGALCIAFPILEIGAFDAVGALAHGRHRGVA